MAYLGRPASAEVSVTGSTDTFTGDGGVTFNLSRIVKDSNASLLEVFVSNVQQQPTVTYSVAGNVLTFVTAPGAGEPIYVTYRDYNVAPVFTVPDSSIVEQKIGPSAVTEGKIADSAVTPAKISGQLPVSKGGTGSASLTANAVLLGNVTSAVTTVSPGTTGNVLTSEGGTWISKANPPSALTNNTDQAITSSGTTNIDLNSGHVVILTMAASVTSLTFSNVPASGTPVEVKLIVKNASSGTYYSITWPSSIYWSGATSVDSVAGGPTLAIGKNGVTVISLLTTDGGTKWSGAVQASIPGGNAYEVYSWGQNTGSGIGGVLGDDSAGIKLVPSPIDSSRWLKISGSATHGVGLKTDGTLWSWGSSTHGQTGLGFQKTAGFYFESVRKPAQIGFGTDWTDIHSGSSFSCAIKSNGTLWAWGINSFGNLAQNDTVSRSSPTQIGALTNWAKLPQRSQGTSAAMHAIKTDGTLWGWGRNNTGQLGDNTVADKSSPVQIGALTNWSEVVPISQTLAIKTDGTLWAWGYGVFGELGINAGGATARRSSPVQVGSDTDWSKISAGSFISGAIKTNGTMWTWGNNNHGGLGHNNTTSRSSPVQIGSSTDWKEIATLGSSDNANSVSTKTLAVKTDGTLWGWGVNNAYSRHLYDKPINSVFSSPVQVGSKTIWDNVTFFNNYVMFATANKGDVNPA